MSELKPCPFCGGKAIKVADCNQIVCPSCVSSSQLYPTGQQAVDAWNRRYQEPNEPLTLEQLRGMDIFGWCWIECLVPFSSAEAKVSAYYQRHTVGTSDGAMKETFWFGYPGMIFGFKYADYGKTWLAYRRKPESEGE